MKSPDISIETLHFIYK